jgi:molybdopterin synthase catalytic subunit
VAESFVLADAAIDAVALRRALEHPAAGAVCVFEGVVRDHHGGRPVLGLRYDAYRELAVSEGCRIMDGVRARYGLHAALCVHRLGALAIGEVAVWIGTSAAHRDAAFAACREAIDAIKADVPIWKHERYADGDAQWLHPT